MMHGAALAQQGAAAAGGDDDDGGAFLLPLPTRVSLPANHIMWACAGLWIACFPVVLVLSVLLRMCLSFTPVWFAFGWFAWNGIVQALFLATMVAIAAGPGVWPRLGAHQGMHRFAMLFLAVCAVVNALDALALDTDVAMGRASRHGLACLAACMRAVTLLPLAALGVQWVNLRRLRASWRAYVCTTRRVRYVQPFSVVSDQEDELVSDSGTASYSDSDSGYSSRSGSFAQHMRRQRRYDSGSSGTRSRSHSGGHSRSDSQSGLVQQVQLQQALPFQSQQHVHQPWTGAGAGATPARQPQATTAYVLGSGSGAAQGTGPTALWGGALAPGALGTVSSGGFSDAASDDGVQDVVELRGGWGGDGGGDNDAVAQRWTGTVDSGEADHGGVVPSHSSSGSASGTRSRAASGASGTVSRATSVTGSRSRTTSGVGALSGSDMGSDSYLGALWSSHDAPWSSSDGSVPMPSRGVDRSGGPDLRVSRGRSSAEAAVSGSGISPRQDSGGVGGAASSSTATSPFGDADGLAAAIAMVAASARDEPGDSSAKPAPAAGTPAPAAASEPMVSGMGHAGAATVGMGVHAGAGAGASGVSGGDPIAFGPSVLPQCDGVTAPWRQHNATARTSATDDAPPTAQPQLQTVWGPHGQLQVGAPWLASPASQPTHDNTFRGSADDPEWHGDSSDDDRFERDDGRHSFDGAHGGVSTHMFTPHSQDVQVASAPHSSPAQPWLPATATSGGQGSGSREGGGSRSPPNDGGAQVEADVPPVLYYPPDAVVPWYPQNQHGAPEDLLRGNINTDDEWVQRQLRELHAHNVAHFEDAQDPFARVGLPHAPDRGPGHERHARGGPHRRPSRPRSPSPPPNRDVHGGAGAGGGAALLQTGGTTRRRATRRADDAADVTLDHTGAAGLQAHVRPGEVLLPDEPEQRVPSLGDVMDVLANIDSGATVRALTELWQQLEPDFGVDRGVDVPPCRLSAMGYLSIFVLVVHAISGSITALGLAPEGSDDFVFAAALLVGTPTVGFVDNSLQPSMRHDIGWVLFLQLFAALPGMATEWGMGVLRAYLDPNVPFIVFLLGMQVLHALVVPLAKFACAWRLYTPLSCLWRQFEEMFSLVFFLRATSWLSFGRLLFIKVTFQLAVNLDLRSIYVWHTNRIEGGHSPIDDVHRVMHTFAQNCVVQLGAVMLFTETVLIDCLMPGIPLTAVVTSTPMWVLLLRMIAVTLTTIAVQALSATWLELLMKFTMRGKVVRGAQGWPSFWRVSEAYLRRHGLVLVVVMLSTFCQVMFRSVRFMSQQDGWRVVASYTF